MENKEDTRLLPWNNVCRSSYVAGEEEEEKEDEEVEERAVKCFCDSRNG